MILNVDDKRDVITISLFSVEASKKLPDGAFEKDGKGFHIREPGEYSRVLFEQKKNVKRIVKRVREEAEKKGRNPPEIVLSVLLIPDWDVEGNSYEQKDYLDTKIKFIEEVRKSYQDLENCDVKVQDFLKEAGLTESEKEYLDQLRAKGGVADIIKTRALINNKDRRHLQMDSNSLIADWGRLYAHTFGANEQKDGLVATFYNPILISANNKVVYAAPNGKLVQNLEPNYNMYIEKNKNNRSDKMPDKNSIYRVVFNKSIADAKYTHKVTDIGKKRYNYPANITLGEYDITNDVLPAINMSWSAGKADEAELSLKTIKPAKVKGVNDAVCDFACFLYLIKKYSNHPIDGEREYAYEAILDRSDIALDMKLMKAFIEKVKEKDSALMPALLRTFKKTPTGNVLCQALFNKNAVALHKSWPLDNPKKQQELNISDVDSIKLKMDLIKADKTCRVPVRAKGYLASAMLENITDKNIEPNLREAIYRFFLGLESGEKANHLINLLYNVERQGISTVLEDKIYNEAQRVLTEGTDVKDRFDFIKNRKETLHLLRSYREKTTAMTSMFNRAEFLNKSKNKKQFIKEIKRTKQDKSGLPKGVKGK